MNIGTQYPGGTIHCKARQEMNIVRSSNRNGRAVIEVLEAICSEFLPECHKRKIKLKILLTFLVIVLPSLANKPNGNSYQRKTTQ